MRQHLIVGRMGTADKTAVPKAKDEVLTELALMGRNRLDHGIGQALDDLNGLGLAPSELGADFLVLAAHVHAADTRISRSEEFQDGWTREVRLVVPVSDPARWAGATLVVTRALNFLTGDRWSVGFRSRPKSHTALVDRARLKIGPYESVNLFSGGLDSLIGAIDFLSAGKTPLLVSHAGEGLVSKSQEACYDGLRAAYTKSAFNRLRVWMSFEHDLVSGVEETTRGRSFLFFALGVAAATALPEPFILNVPENGLIALNVPLDPLRLGALSTRTTHPFYMARWNELLRALGINGRLDNPYWDRTKGEMVAACGNAALLKKLLPHSLSCSSPSKGRWRGEAQGHCGYCLPCLIRRAALLGIDNTTYSLANLKARHLDTKQAEGRQVRSFQLAIDRLAKRPDLAAVLIHKPGPLYDNPAHQPALAGVYRRGLEEVGRLIAGVRTAPL